MGSLNRWFKESTGKSRQHRSMPISLSQQGKWGEYNVLDYTAYGDGTSSLTKSMFIIAGKSISYQSHTIRDEIWTIVDGTGDLLIDGHVRNVKRGDVTYITKEQKHAIMAATDLRMIEVQIDVELVEMDIERYDWKWERD